MRPIRAFISIALDERVKRELVLVQKRLQKLNPDIKLVEPASLHLTLNFLGDISPTLIETIEEAIDRTAASVAPFHIDIGTLGAFPNTTTPSVLWAGITKRVNILTEMAEHLSKELKGITAQEIREFSPHITLARLKTPEGSTALATALDSLSLPSGISQKVEGITLFRSELLPRGPLYHLLYTAPLSGGTADQERLLTNL